MAFSLHQVSIRSKLLILFSKKWAVGKFRRVQTMCHQLMMAKKDHLNGILARRLDQLILLKILFRFTNLKNRLVSQSTNN